VAVAVAVELPTVWLEIMALEEPEAQEERHH
jgi:hypothetical protein